MKEKYRFKMSVISAVLSLSLAAPAAMAQLEATAGESSIGGSVEAGASVQVEAAQTPAAVSAENTLAACTDTVDNDGDRFVDCADQDCIIFATCASAGNGAQPQSAAAKTDSVQIFERGKLCRDGIDNDSDGLIDCHDAECKETHYCQREMYEYPYSAYKAPGIFFQFGIGLALPNYNWKDTRVNSRYGTNIPFDPDMGGMMNFKVGVLPIPWIGVGMNINMGGTFGSNRADFLSLTDLDTKYKYDGYKMFGHVGGFVRLQYPARRFTAYMDVSGGASFARYKWRVYDGAESWSDISDSWDDSDWEDDSDAVEHDTRYKQAHHFTLVLEPGFDFYVVERTVAVGMHGWFPVFASSNSGMDNVGILFNATFTPTWREQKRLKDEYK